MALSRIEQTRLAISRTADAKKRAKLGQFFTPSSIAHFMAGFFDSCAYRECRLLDAGAGIGSLSAAFLDRCSKGDLAFKRVEANAFELDADLLPHLSETLDGYARHQGVDVNIQHADFIELAAEWLSGDLFSEKPKLYTHAVLNPPYKKIRSNSDYRLALRRAGIETVNLYSAFVALALSLLEDHGQLVAIIPRSFCNGPYYRPFRDHVFAHSTIRHIHLFESRSKAFKDDDVLQENIIIQLERGGEQGAVTISTSTDDSFRDLESHDYPFSNIVLPNDPERFIHIPTSAGDCFIEQSKAIHCRLVEIGVEISTGPVVDFRLKEHLRKMPEPGTVPLLYPGHFNGKGLEWPKLGFKKPNAILRNPDTERWLYPTGSYCVVRRFSAKEEKRRVVAMVVDATAFPETPLLGFENHLNLFHERKHGLPKALAHGLAVYLNSTGVDEYFRRFNGHTQVNATDLRALDYPSRKTLVNLGAWAMKAKALTQEMIDQKIGSLTE
ncbi:MAG: Eco57I restriction-modification methylase domain-containing protein [Planctomycetes bacterium]|nr:Eco57I restriction-modification methylase domain-containing protein [Planctomycetota bacterium]